MARRPPFEAYKGSAPYVFVSYAHDDADWVYDELAWLREQGINIWYDEGIEPGRDWNAVLAESIGGSTGLVFFVTGNSAESAHVSNEVHFALDAGKPVIAVYREETMLPPGLRFALNRQQAIIRSNLAADAYQRKLVRAVTELGQSVAAVDVTAPVPGFSGRPAIAVMSFKGSPADEGGSYFADGLTDELVTGLQAWRTIPVISRDSTRGYSGDEVSLQRLARELGVGFVLRGSVRRAGQRIRVNVQLADARNGHQIWAERFDGELADVFDLQDEITQRIIGAIEPEVLEQEMDRSSKVPTTNLDAWDLYLRGLARFTRQTFDDLRAAREYWQQASAMDPNLVHAIAGQSLVAVFLLLNHRGRLSDAEAAESRRRTKELAEQAMRIDARSLPALTARLAYLLQEEAYDAAVELAEQALELYPASANTWRVCAYALLRSGRFEQALDRFTMAKRLSPRDPQMWLITNQEGFCLFSLGRYEEALPSLEQSITLKSDHLWPHLFQTLSLSMLGRKDEARHSLARFLTDVPDFGAHQLNEIPRDMAERFLTGLRELGWEG